MTEVKGPAPSILDKVKEPSREESETRRKDFEQHVAAQPGFATAASVLARDTFPGGRGDVDAGEVSIPDTAPTRAGTEPGIGPARNDLPKIIVPAPPAAELDERLRATTPPVPKGVRSTARYEAVELAPSSAAPPEQRTRKIVVIAAVCLLLASALAYFATRREEVVPPPSPSSAAATESAPLKSTTAVTAIATATTETSTPPAPSTGASPTSSAPDRSATSKRSASAKVSAQPTQDATATSTTATVKTVPSPTTSSPPTSTVPWIKPQNQ